MLKEAAYYAKMAFYFQEYLRTPPVVEPVALVRQHVERREENFLETLGAGVFGNSRTPLTALFALAGCGAADLRESLRKCGLEKTLERLSEAGVYLTNAEAKGLVPLVRHGREIPFNAGAFENPRQNGGMQGGSSGSRSHGVTGETSTEWRIYRECYEALWREEFGLADYHEVSLMPILPAPWGLSHAAAAARLGGRVERWFSVGGKAHKTAHYRSVTAALVTEGRMLGYSIPFPEYLPTGAFGPVVDYLAECAQGPRPAFVRGTVSAITRICTAARESGQSIAGTQFLAGGEALTAARRALVTSAGCQVYSRYMAHETGPIGVGCRRMTEGNTVHLFTDALAVTVRRRTAALAETEVDSLAFTTLNPRASRIYVNAELDDSARLVTANCDCAFSRAGLTVGLTDIQSFGKLTGFGMTLVGTQILPILEEKLPQRFGGGAADFQLVERTGEAQMELRLRVDPRLSVDPEQVRRFFLDEIGKVYGGALTRRTWEHAATLRVVLARPYATKTGKILPLHLAMFGEANDAE